MGKFKAGEATTYAGLVKNSHPRYYFNYFEDDKLVMVQCDNLRILRKWLHENSNSSMMSISKFSSTISANLFRE